MFKIFKLPLNKWTVPTAILGGVVLIALTLVVMNYNHPYTTLVREYFVTTPIVPDVQGQVVEVPVEANQPLKEGDVLFRIDRYQRLLSTDAVAQADFDRAKRNFESAQAQLSQAQAAERQAAEKLESGGDRVICISRSGAASAAPPSCRRRPAMRPAYSRRLPFVELKDYVG